MSTHLPRVAIVIAGLCGLATAGKVIQIPLNQNEASPYELANEFAKRVGLGNTDAAKALFGSRRGDNDLSEGEEPISLFKVI